MVTDEERPSPLTPRMRLLRALSVVALVPVAVVVLNVWAPQHITVGPLPTPTAPRTSGPSDASDPSTTDPSTPAGYASLALGIIDEHGLLAKTPQWQDRRPTPDGFAGATAVEGTYDLLATLVQVGGGPRSTFIAPSDVPGFRVGTGAERTPTESKDGITVVQVGAFDGLDDSGAQAYATKLAGDLTAHASQTTCGWILDLRGNRGGLLWPTLAGLTPVLTEGPQLALVDNTGTGRIVETSSGNVFDGGQLRSRVRIDTRPQARPVAILQDHATTGSAEGVALAFRHQGQTRSFGTDTAGARTFVEYFDLPDHALLGLETARLDPYGPTFSGPVPPQQATSPETAEAAAIAWLHGVCR